MIISASHCAISIMVKERQFSSSPRPVVFQRVVDLIIDDDGKWDLISVSVPDGN
jgi:hypothetical protein